LGNIIASVSTAGFLCMKPQHQTIINRTITVICNSYII